ncbi:SMI1/KNR4 family protein [Streptomyces sp. NPDC051183]|uniref:SMI1/KNR4 family protein n=1 Tax=Streptomyces sp. NPDC051183 TaxID=3155165 RepID=UPI00342F8067
MTDARHRVAGLDAAEIAAVAGDQSASIGEAYREFLKIAGKSAGRLFVGSDIFFPQMLGLWGDSKDLLDENDCPPFLQSTDRVFMMHQGYQFYFLRGIGDDPEVWSYCEGDSTPKQDSPKFTDWLRCWVDRYLAALG